MGMKNLLRKYYELIEMCIDFYNSDEVSENLKLKCLEMAADVNCSLTCKLQVLWSQEKTKLEKQVDKCKAVSETLKKEKTEQA